MTSPSIGTVRVSCDAFHQILVTALCTDTCSNFLVSSNGYSPLTVRGLDPGMRYSVTITVYDGNQEVLINQSVKKAIRVINTTPSKINDHISFQTCYA